MTARRDDQHRGSKSPGKRAAPSVSRLHRRKGMKLAAIALDYDGTIAVDGVLDPNVREAIGAARQEGIAVILVTGRRFADLRRVAGDLRCFDVVVGENGAVLDFPASGRHVTIGHPPARVFIEELERRGVEFTCWRNRDRNRRDVCPGGARRAAATPATADPGVQPRPPHGAAAGRGEIDGASPGAAGAAAVDPQHRRDRRRGKRSRSARRVRGRRRRGVGQRRATRRRGRSHRRKRAAGRRRLHPPHRAAAAAVRGANGPPTSPARPSAQRRSRHLAVRGRTVLIAGEPGTGKSWLAGLLCEQLILQGYSMCIIDPEGDYRSLEALPGVVTLGGEDPPPRARDLVRALRHPDVSVIVDLSKMPHHLRTEYLHTLLPLLITLRRHTGLATQDPARRGALLPGRRRRRAADRSRAGRLHPRDLSHIGARHVDSHDERCGGHGDARNRPL